MDTTFDSCPRVSDLEAILLMEGMCLMLYKQESDQILVEGEDDLHSLQPSVKARVFDPDGSDKEVSKFTQQS